MFWMLVLQNVTYFSADKSASFNYMNELCTPGRQVDQVVPNLPSPTSTAHLSPTQLNAEHFSRKVFVGGLPPDIDEGLLLLLGLIFCLIA